MVSTVAPLLFESRAEGEDVGFFLSLLGGRQRRRLQVLKVLYSRRSVESEVVSLRHGLTSSSSGFFVSFRPDSRQKRFWTHTGPAPALD
jgi:hypothetical protein